VKRRDLVASVGSGTVLAAVAGCLAASGDTVRPDTDPDRVPADFTCEDGSFDRYPAGYDPDELRWGDAGNASIRVGSLAYEYGDTAELTLTAPERGNSDKWNVELFTERGWVELRAVETDRAPSNTDEDVDGGHTWNLELTEAGIAEASRHADRVRVCPDLVSGRYRFVYHGVLGDGGAGGGSVAAAFDVEV